MAEATESKQRRKRSRSSKSKDHVDKREKIPEEQEGENEDSVANVERIEREDNKADETGVEQDAQDDDNEEKENDDDEVNEDDGKTKRKRKRKRKAKSESSAKGGSTTNPSEQAKTAKFSSLDHTVYVEGIPFDCSEEDVQEFFVSHGCADIIQLRLPRWQDSGRLRGYGHVVFDSEESRQKAVDDLNGKTIGTRYLTIQAPKAPRPDTSMGAVEGRQSRTQPEGCKTVHVKNLPYDATEDDIRDMLQVCGKIVDGGIRIARNYQTRQSKGFAYVEYKNPEGAHAAVQKASKPFGMTVKGRPCFVDYEEGTMKGSYKTEDGRLWTREYGKTKK